MTEVFLCILHEGKKLSMAVYSSENGKIELSDI
jgi:hypothetical protein